MSHDVVDKTLREGIEQFSFTLTESAVSGMVKYVNLLLKWNKAYNLTAIRDPREIVIKHLLDSLAIVPFIHGPRVMDMGTGGGLPGIPLALVFPEIGFTLLDSNGKKTRFLNQVKAELALSNVTIVHSRAEQIDVSVGFEQIVSRAFSSLELFVNLGEPLLTETGELLAMKGTLPHKEIDVVDVAGKRVDVIPLAVPLLPDSRHLIIMRSR